MLTPRQKMILSAVVEDYVQSAEPIGSRMLSKREEISLSAATIRNEMADLEEMGYLDQPHTSAGRIPSHKGYRFYVDNLMSSPDMDEHTVNVLQSMFRQRMDEVERIIQQTSVVLSELTKYTTIVLGPKIYEESIHQVQLIPLHNGKAIAIMVTETGHVESRQVQLSEEVPSEDVAQMVNLLNAKLKGAPLSKLRSTLYREISNEMAAHLEHFEDALGLLEELRDVSTNRENKVYVGGATNILSQPEFRDIERVRPLLQFLENSGHLQLALPIGKDPIQVRIGGENGEETLQDCTVISATYHLAGKPVGSVGILGPTRMNYARVVRILDYVSHQLSDVLTNHNSS